MWLQRETKDDVIWSDMKLGGHLQLNAILFQSWRVEVKQDQILNYPLLS